MSEALISLCTRITVRLQKSRTSRRSPPPPLPPVPSWWGCESTVRVRIMHEISPLPPPYIFLVSFPRGTAWVGVTPPRKKEKKKYRKKRPMFFLTRFTNEKALFHRSKHDTHHPRRIISSSRLDKSITKRPRLHRRR